MAKTIWAVHRGKKASRLTIEMKDGNPKASDFKSDSPAVLSNELLGHSALVRISLALSWFTKERDWHGEPIEKHAFDAQEAEDVRWIYTRVRTLRQSKASGDDAWIAARVEFIEHVLREAGFGWPNDALSNGSQA